MTPTPTNGTLKTIKVVSAILGLIVALSIVSNLLIRAQVQDTVEAITCKKIVENDDLDAARFYTKEKGIVINTNVENLIKKVDKNVIELEKINDKMDAQMQLLYKINAKLDDSI